MFDIEHYFEAKTLQEAVDYYAVNPQCRIIAGGTDLLIKMHRGRLEQAKLIGINKIQSLKSIKLYEDGTIGIGALSTFRDIDRSPVIKENLVVLSEGAAAMGGPQIRAVATVGGNICNGVPSADGAPPLFVHNALLRLKSKTGERTLPIAEFYQGPGFVRLMPGEILKEIIVAPENYIHFAGHYIKFSMRRAMDIATLSVAVNCKIDHDGSFSDLRICLGVAGPTPIRCIEAEKFAIGEKPSLENLKNISSLVLESTKIRTSWRASGHYREHLAVELTKRALTVAVNRAGGDDFV